MTVDNLLFMENHHDKNLEKQKISENLNSENTNQIAIIHNSLKMKNPKKNYPQ